MKKNNVLKFVACLGCFCGIASAQVNVSIPLAVSQQFMTNGSPVQLTGDVVGSGPITNVPTTVATAVVSRTNVNSLVQGSVSLTTTFTNLGPQVTLPRAGWYKISYIVNPFYSGATLVGNGNFVFGITRTNNTTTLIDTNPATPPIVTVTLFTSYVGDLNESAYYFTTNTNDVVCLQGKMTSTLTAGSIGVLAPRLFADQLSRYP
jgi:hypothetical protein